MVFLALMPIKPGAEVYNHGVGIYATGVRDCIAVNEVGGHDLAADRAISAPSFSRSCITVRVPWPVMALSRHRWRLWACLLWGVMRTSDGHGRMSG